MTENRTSSLAQQFADGAVINACVLISGRGSNLKALLKAQRYGAFKRLRIACVVSNVKDAPGLEFAYQNNVPVIDLPDEPFSDREAFERFIVERTEEYNIQLIILAGYMRIIGDTLLRRWPNAIVNIHPSLLPSFPGLHAQKQAVEYGVRFSGCTVHFVDAGLDSGPIIAQRVVPVEQGDTEVTLSERILVEEHDLYKDALKAITEQPWTICGRTVIFDDSVHVPNL